MYIISPILPNTKEAVIPLIVSNSSAAFAAILVIYRLHALPIVVRAKLSDYGKQPADREVIPFCRHVSDRPHVPGLSLVS